MERDAAAAADAVEDYLDAAAGDGRAGRRAGPGRLPGFLEPFAEVEDALPLVSDAVDAQVALAATAVSDARDAAQRRLLLVSLLALAAVVGVGRLVVRGVVGPLRRVGRQPRGDGRRAT